MINITTNIKDVARRFQALPGQIERGVLQTGKDVSDTIVRLMKRAGLPVRYPIHWDSPKQQRKYFATQGFGKGIPYHRTDGYINAWQSKAIPGGGQAENIGHKALMLAGSPSGNIIGSKVTASGQSHIQAGRWQLIKPVIEYVVSKLPEKLLRALKVSANV
jgi:hypothetical protein